MSHTDSGSRSGTRRRLSDSRAAAVVMLVGSIAVIGGALLFQYVGKLEPCELCLLGRWPYYIGIPLLVVAAIGGNRRAVAVSVFAIVGLVFLAGAGLSFYHVGVEQHWFPGPTECTATATEATSIEALKAQLMAQEPVRCDVVQWSLFGISLAGWNFIASLGLAALSAASLRRAWRSPSTRSI